MLIDFGFKLEVTLPKFRKRMNKKQPINDKEVNSFDDIMSVILEL